MTEYGRGPGAQGWQPEDPLYGDQGWAEQQHAQGAQPGQGDPYGSWDPYGQQQYPEQQAYPQQQDPYQQYPQQQQPYPQQQQFHQQDQQGQQGYYQQPGQEQGWDAQGGQYYADPYAQQQGGGYDQQGYQDPYAAQQQGYPAPDAYQGQQQPGQPPQQQQHQQPHQPHPEQQPHQPEPATRQRRPEPEPAGAPGGPGPDPDTGWDPGPDQGEADFFSRADEDDDWDDEPRGRERRGGKGKSKGKSKGKQRNGCACLVVAVVLAGGLGGAAYYGYDFYQSRFGPAPDYVGEGTGEVQVTIPAGASLSQMGNLLKKEDVVKSHDAFVAAATKDGVAPIQAGVYTLRQQMSADAAVAMLTDPAQLNTLIIAEGMRASQIFTAIDLKLELAEGTTEEAAENGDIGLPEWAEGEVEGFLFPARYDVGDDTTPEDLLSQMVDRAEAEFAEIDLEGQAETLGFTPREVIIIASLVQAEAQLPEEFGKVSRVIYNRLEVNQALGFDSTINYVRDNHSLDVSIEDTKIESPYNTYKYPGLPPGPINNPGHQAFEAAAEPTEGDWLYFVTVKPGDTRFEVEYEKHLEHVDDFNAEQARNRESGN
ncbi:MULTISPECIES: endolytic transglycosylase MltG [Streptomyces]|uniref:endolytic transglycosylase MltG n=1 Tax=Streptomyces TaxID=1883 RepID=UPI00159147ED|nr:MULTISPECIES: endolytic transglycosylase MltG [Streptomyces]QKV67763.1 endolytic transglycosylase MltG [Streptomyces harbinensis]